MINNSLEITPSITVHNLLKAFPQLEDVLIDIAPPFKKLKNPLLRRSVAKVATLKHIAAVGDVPLDELIAQLRKAVGQIDIIEHYKDEFYFTEQPDWLTAENVVLSIEESELESRNNEMILVEIMRQAKILERGEIIELLTTFLPAPGIDIMKSKGYLVWSQKTTDDIIKTYFLKNA